MSVKKAFYKGGNIKDGDAIMDQVYEVKRDWDIDDITLEIEQRKNTGAGLLFKEYSIDELKMIGEYWEALTEWPEDKLRKGYDIFVGDKIPDALHISQIDMINAFDGDENAAKQAQADGIALIEDNLLPEYYIDTPENRALIYEYLENRRTKCICGAEIYAVDMWQASDDSLWTLYCPICQKNILVDDKLNTKAYKKTIV